MTTARTSAAATARPAHEQADRTKTRAVEPLCLDDLDDAALDRLPFGVVCLRADGTVLRLNCAEAECSGIQRWRAIGRDYFREVAGTNAAQLATHVAELPPGANTRVFYTFRGFHRADDAVIDLSRGEAGRVYLCIRSTEGQ